MCNTCDKVVLVSEHICDVRVQYTELQQRLECKQMQQLRRKTPRVLQRIQLPCARSAER